MPFFLTKLPICVELNFWGLLELILPAYYVVVMAMSFFDSGNNSTTSISSINHSLSPNQLSPIQRVKRKLLNSTKKHNNKEQEDSNGTSFLNAPIDDFLKSLKSSVKKPNAWFLQTRITRWWDRIWCHWFQLRFLNEAKTQFIDARGVLRVGLPLLCNFLDSWMHITKTCWELNLLSPYAYLENNRQYCNFQEENFI